MRKGLLQLTKDQALGDLARGAFANPDLPAAPDRGAIELFFDGNQFDDI